MQEVDQTSESEEEGQGGRLTAVLYLGQQAFASAQRIASGPVSKSISVYSHDSNPSIDSPRFRISRDDAAFRVAAGYVRYLSPTAVQLKPPDGLRDSTNTIAGGLFQTSWAPRMSANYLVWQMRSDENC